MKKNVKRKAKNLKIWFRSLFNAKAFYIIILFLHCSLFIVHCSFALDVPRFSAEEVVVTASRLPEKLSRSPWNVVVIKGEQAQTYGAETVADALRLVPGVDVYAAGDKGALNTVRIKGSNAAQVLIMLDGCRINSPLTGQVDLGDLLLADVDKLEVVTAPLSSVYGSDAISGVINIITKKEQKKDRQEYALALGSFGEQTADLSFGNDNFILTALYDKTNGFRENSAYAAQNYSYHQKFITPLGGIRLGISYYAADKGVPGVPNSAADPTTASTPNNHQVDKNLNLNLEYDQTFGSSSFYTKVYQYATDQKYHEYNFSSTSFSDYTYKTAQQGINMQDSFTLNGLGNFSVGLEYRGEGGQSSNIGDRQVHDLAVYVNQEAGQGPLLLSLGLRADQHSIAGVSLAPRMGMSFLPAEDWKIWGNIATAFRAPSLNDLYWNDPIWLMYGDANLRPENSVGVQMGVNKYFGKGSVFGASVFARQVTDQILWEFDPATYITRAKNVGRVEVSGVDLQYNADLLPGFAFFANAVFQAAVDREDVTASNIGKEIPYSPRSKTNAGLNWENRLGKMALVAKYVGERYSDAGNTHKLASYLVADLTYFQKIGAFNLNAKVNNLFNTTYSEAVGWHPVSYAILNYPMPGRSFTVGANINL